MSDIDDKSACATCKKPLATGPSSLTQWIFGPDHYCIGDIDVRGWAAELNRYEGLAVEKDYKQAMQWFLRAAQNGSQIACENVGLLYQDGKGVKKDLTEARQWFARGRKPGKFSDPEID